MHTFSNNQSIETMFIKVWIPVFLVFMAVNGELHLLSVWSLTNDVAQTAVHGRSVLNYGGQIAPDNLDEDTDCYDTPLGRVCNRQAGGEDNNDLPNDLNPIPRPNEVRQGFRPLPNDDEVSIQPRLSEGTPIIIQIFNGPGKRRPRVVTRRCSPNMCG